MLTPNQQRALDRTRHLSVTANAGSGKTRVLVERYLSFLLGGHAAVSEIVALTYTEKAAGELKRKIAAALTRALEQSPDPVQHRRLEETREQLSSAFIGTIHSFCARILREYPVEAGVDAAFAVIEGLDQELLLQEAITSAFRRLLRDGPDGPLRESLFDVVRVLGKSRLSRIVTALVDRRELLLRWHGTGGLYRESDETILAKWHQRLEACVDGALHARELREDLALIMGVGSGKGAEAARAQFKEFLQCTDSSVERVLYKSLMERILKKDGELLKSFIGKGDGDQRVRGETMRVASNDHMLRPLIDALARPGSELQHRRLVETTRTLLAVAQTAAEIYEQQKIESGQLDFEDLQLRMRELLGREQVREVLARRFRFIMVDEYQDTNRLQYDILLPLVSGLQSGNLFIVGDPKQSIYGFRGADVAVFEQTRNDIRERSRESGEVILGESFRPLRDVAAFINLVFSQLMHVPAEEDPRRPPATHEVPFDPLVKARANNAPGRVEVLLTDGADEDDAPDEPDLIARRIVELHASGYPVFDMSERPHPLQFRDVAVLLRSRRFLPDLEEAFIRHSIPYIVSSGVGYFQTQDILDFFNYFQFLLDQADDAALAGVLRSPFFGVSDADLFAWCAGRNSGSLWDYLNDEARAGRYPAALRGAVEILREDCAIGSSLPVPELVARIVDRTLYLAKIAGTSRGDQSLANLQKLQRMARYSDAQGFSGLHEFTKRLKRLIDEEEREGQGTIESQRDAVQIMTVHAAKGLEFPLVVLPTLHRQFSFDREPFFDEEVGVVFPVDDEEDGAPAGIVQYGEWLSRSRTIAEEKRIFYVAATRARDFLILSGKPNRKASTINWMRWLTNGLGLDGDFPDHPLEFRAVTETLASREQQFVPGREEHTLTVHLLRSGQVQTATVPSPAAPSSGRPVLMIDPVAAQSKGDIFSATKIRTYNECPGKYYLRYVLGLPKGTGPFARREDEELKDAEFPAELRGRAFHAIMEHVGVQGNGTNVPLAKILDVLALEGGAARREMQRLAEEIARMVDHVVQAPFWKEVEEGQETRTEFTISLGVAGEFLTGTIDRLFRSAQGQWTIIDFKTDAVDLQSLEEKARGYLPQLEFYAVLVARLFSVDEVRTTLLFAGLPSNPYHRVLNREELAGAEASIMRAISKIKSGEFPPRDPVCADCPLRPSGCKSLPPAA